MEMLKQMLDVGERVDRASIGRLCVRIGVLPVHGGVGWGGISSEGLEGGERQTWCLVPEPGRNARQGRSQAEGAQWIQQ